MTGSVAQALVVPVDLYNNILLVNSRTLVTSSDDFNRSGQ